MLLDSTSQISPEQRKQKLVDFYHELKDCPKCELCKTRTNVVFGSGDSNADLMFVGEAPGFHEDQQAKPFVGQAGKLLEKLLAEISLTREQVFIANVLKCRPPDNRDPRPEEIDACKGFLHKQIELICPRVICTLGNFSTKLLRGKPDGITKVHGTPELHTFNGRTVFLYPIFHPAAALYTPTMLETLRVDFVRLPQLLADDPPQTGETSASQPGKMARAGAQTDSSKSQISDEHEPRVYAEEANQMGLF